MPVALRERPRESRVSPGCFKMGGDYVGERRLASVCWETMLASESQQLAKENERLAAELASADPLREQVTRLQ
eukprot:9500207-Pyramimonas_sp.AAC.1